MGRDTVIFLESVPVCVAVGTVLGFLSGLGVGGGSLLILWLTAVLGMEQRMAQGINLLFFLPSAAVSCLFHWKQGRLNLGVAIPAIVAGVLAAAFCAWAGFGMEEKLLKKLFGGLLIFIGLWELLAPRKDK